MRKILFFGVLSILLLFLSPTPYTLNPAFAQSCTTSPRADGLISAPQVSATTKFGTNSGACTINPKAAFAPYKVPTFDDLKSLYYTQAKSSVRKDQIQGNPSQGEFTSKFTQNNIVLVNGDLPDVNYTGTTKPSIVFVEGNLTIGNDITYGDANSGLVFVVKGDVNIASTVTRIDAIIISSGTIYTAGAGCATSSVTTNAPLTIYGSLISLKQPPDNDPSASYIKFCRSFGNNSLPAEVINNQVKYLVILRNLMSNTFQRWSEVTETASPTPTAPGETPAPAPTAPSTPQFPLGGLVHYYKIDETSGATVADSVIAGSINGTSYSSIVTGKIGKARSGISNGDTISFTGSLIGTRTEGSISLWVSSSNSSIAGNRFIYDEYSSTGGAIDAFYLARRYSDNKIVFGGLESSSALTWGSGLWHHIVATWTPSSTKLYIDGVLSASNNLGGYTTREIFRSYLGGCSGDLCSFPSIEETIDEVGFWNRALTDTEVVTLSNGLQP